MYQLIKFIHTNITLLQMFLSIPLILQHALDHTPIILYCNMHYVDRTWIILYCNMYWIVHRLCNDMYKTHCCCHIFNWVYTKCAWLYVTVWAIFAQQTEINFALSKLITYIYITRLNNYGCSSFPLANIN